MAASSYSGPKPRLNCFVAGLDLTRDHLPCRRSLPVGTPNAAPSSSLCGVGTFRTSPHLLRTWQGIGCQEQPLNTPE